MRRSLPAPLALVLSVALAACGGRVVERRRTADGPFEIETRVVRISTGAFPNTSGNPFETMPVTYFALFHRGALVTVQTTQGPRDEFWEARFLAGAPRPAALLADNGVYLVSAGEAGALDVRVLMDPDHDMPTLQLLDARAGQPGDQESVGIHDGSAEPRTLGGGTLLLVGGQCVLDVTTLGSRCVRLNDWDTLQALDQYYAAGARPIALSPRRTQVAFTGSRQAGMDYDYAVVVADYARGSAYVLPFERDFARFESVWDATPAWLEHYFEWTVAPDGTERLRPRPDARPRPWQGKLSRYGETSVDYVLRPARRELMPVLVAFVERALGVTFEPEPGNADQMRAAAGGGQLTIWFRAEDRSLSLFSSGAASPELATTIGRLGAQFDEVLARGEHQSLFGSFR